MTTELKGMKQTSNFKTKLHKSASWVLCNSKTFQENKSGLKNKWGVNATSMNNSDYFSNQIAIQNQQRKTRRSLVALIAPSIRFSFTKTWWGTSGNTEENKRADES